MPIFDGPNLTITLDAPSSGTLNVDVEADLYSEWKEWSLLSDNIKYPPAFERVVGGDPLSPGIAAGAYFLLNNLEGWRIKPFEANHTVFLTGNLAAADPDLSLTDPTDGGFTVLINNLQPVTQNVDSLLEGQNDTFYLGSVHVDTIDGVSGTDYPIGTASEAFANR
jgi:hypothetical protein